MPIFKTINFTSNDWLFFNFLIYDMSRTMTTKLLEELIEVMAPWNKFQTYWNITSYIFKLHIHERKVIVKLMTNYAQLQRFRIRLGKIKMNGLCILIANEL